MSAPLVSRGPIGLISAFLAGSMSVALLVVAMRHINTPLMFLAYCAAFPLYLAGLGAGGLSALIACVSGVAALYMTGPPNIAFFYVFAYAVPAMALTMMALRYRVGDDQKVYWYPESKLLMAVTLYPCALFLIAAIGSSGHEGGLLDLTRQALMPVSDRLAKQFGADEAELFHSAMESAVRIAPALLAYTWIIIAVISMGVAQIFLQQSKWNLRDNFSVQAIQAPNWLIYAVAVTGLAGVFAPDPYGYMGKNLSLILGLPYFLVGVSIVHAWAANMKRPKFFLLGPGMFLLAFYVVLTCAPWTALAVAALGIADHWADFRKRIANRKSI
jgi:hypothetical protein